MASYIGKATDAIFGALDTGATIANDYVTNQAKLSTQNKQIKLKSDIQEKMLEIQRSNTSDQWETKINDYFQSIKSGMSDKNSPYYCKNNLQAEMFTPILDEARVNVTGEVKQLVYKADREKAIVDYRNSLALLSQTESGQNYINKANELAKNLFDCGYITREQYQTQLDTNFNTAYIDTATKAFDGTVEAAIKRGDSKENLIKMALDNVTSLMGIDTDGLPKTFDKEAMNKTLKKTFEQNYNAYLADYQQGNANKLSEINQQMRQASTAEDKLAIARRGQQTLSRMTGNMLSEDDRNKYAAYFEYELKGGSNGSSGSSSALKKLNPDDRMKFYFNAIENSNETSVYDAKKDLNDELLAEFREITGNPNANIVDVQQAFPEVGAFLKEARNHLPPDLKDVISFAENAINATLNTKDNKKKYEEEFNGIMEAVYEIVFDADIKNAGPDAKKEIKARVIRAINANLGGVLEKQKDYKEYFGKDYEGIKTLSDYREGVIESKEARMAKAMQERDANPDLVYTKENGLEVPFALQKGLASLENDERDELKQLIKAQTGRDVDDGEIDMHYESDGKNDVTARRRYTIDGWDYRFRTEDGKHIILEKKKNSKPGDKAQNEAQDNKGWEIVKTVSQQKEYDSPKAVTKRTEKEVTSIVKKTNWKNTTIPAGGFTYTDDDGKEQKLTYTDPEGEEKPINQSYWKLLRPAEKTRIIMDFMEKNPEAAEKWLKSIQ